VHRRPNAPSSGGIPATSNSQTLKHDGCIPANLVTAADIALLSLINCNLPHEKPAGGLRDDALTIGLEAI
jgi:hypothetical protein